MQWNNWFRQILVDKLLENGISISCRAPAKSRGEKCTFIWRDQPRDQIQHQHSWQSDAIPSRGIQYAVHSTFPKMLNLNLTSCLLYRRYSWWRSERNYTWGNSWTRAEWYFTPALVQSISAKGQRSGDCLRWRQKSSSQQHCLNCYWTWVQAS